eukprot:1194751-Prorocentrum_minimum.AAC.6
MFYSKASRLFRYAYHNTGLALFLAGMLFSSIVSAVLIHGFHVEKPRVSCVVAKRSEGGQILRLWACESPQSARRNPQGKAMLLDITCIGGHRHRVLDNKNYAHWFVFRTLHGHWKHSLYVPLGKAALLHSCTSFSPNDAITSLIHEY